MCGGRFIKVLEPEPLKKPVKTVEESKKNGQKKKQARAGKNTEKGQTTTLDKFIKVLDSGRKHKLEDFLGKDQTISAEEESKGLK